MNWFKTLLLMTLLTSAAEAQVQFGFFRTSKPPSLCPPNYLEVPPLAGYTSSTFCVAKYEAKQSGGVAVSVAAGAPWGGISRSDANDACIANGTKYSMITNAQWQTVARNIEAQAVNWSGGNLNTSFINSGHTGSTGLLAAGATDSNACSGTGVSCSDTVFAQQRRIHKLSTGAWIWDFAGNVEEWISDNAPSILNSTYMINSTSTLKTNYGPANTYSGSNTTSAPYGGLGAAAIGSAGGAGTPISRGGHSSDTTANGGIFRVYGAGNTTSSSRGFRCVYTP